jgi:hypothetical protein
MNTYTYPTGISTDGAYVVGSYFGGSVNYFWSASTGIISISGTPYGISDNGVTTGTFSNPSVLYNGSNVQTAGTWDHSTSQWTFLGMNPLSPTITMTDYNSGWDITADGTTVVGLQYWPGYVFSAFKWTQSGGYENIGSGVGTGSRASGISADGSVVYGWAQTSLQSRTPVIWHNNQVIYVNGAQPGEAFGASTTGNYATGTTGGLGFRWSPQGTVTFSNTLNAGSINPSTVLNNGTVFGYTDASWPPNPLNRRAFARDSLGVLMTFNDYAAARGLANAQQWTFYSINDASADGNKLLGAGKTPDGQNVTFIMEFAEALPVVAANPQSIGFGTQQVGTTSPYQTITIKNGGGGSLHLSGITLGGTNSSQFVMVDNNIYPLSLTYGDSIMVTVAFAPTSAGNKTASVDISGTNGSLQVPLSGTGSPGVGIQEPGNTSFSVGPNPVSEVLHIKSPAEISTVSLFDMNGRVVAEQTGEGSRQLHLSLGNYPKGSYLVVCTTRDGLRFSAPVYLIAK